uniref:Uncharacterized protein n=1 Tax=Amphimedon queenslandica TaxID=400682 RepID=A0A1X7T1C6_AMPQE
MRNHIPFSLAGSSHPPYTLS